MFRASRFARSTAALAPILTFTTTAFAGMPVQLGPRPFYLVDRMSDGDLKRALQTCADGQRAYTPHDFSIGHRGAPLQFPEHTVESYVAAARMGAGILECDVTFTKDGELVCRHAQCDLHTTTNILSTDLARTCRRPFTPAEFGEDGTRTRAASALCCTTDITLAEFKSLEGKMDAANPDATTVEDYLDGTAGWRTDLYATGGTLLSHRESIRLFRRLGAKFTPELKGISRDGNGDPVVAKNDGFGESGLNQESYARKMIQEYLDAGVRPRNVYAQSFNLGDVLRWIDAFPRFGQQAVYLIRDTPAGPLTGHPRVISRDPPSKKEFEAVYDRGVRVLAPPMPVLVTSKNGKIRPSRYARRAKRTGFDLISWTTERSGRLVEEVVEGRGSVFYYQTTVDGLRNDGDIMTTIHVLAKQVGIKGLFSDWPATTTFYANCMLDRDPGDDGDDA